ncbi:hypothetical protein RAS1_18890 [Phycisphaerae bacterium RAS1]|nr:hypothetical protein RAS1_18890 [Phycisphaerae bacterium RAS1]
MNLIRRIPCLLLPFALAHSSRAGTLSIVARNNVALAATTTDQFGQSFTVAGLSGVTHAGGTAYIAVMDNSNKLVFLDATLNPDGSIASAVFNGGLSLSQTRDFEGIAWTGPYRNTVLLSEEGDPSILEFSLADGALVQTIPAPAVFANRRSNMGFESVTLSTACGVIWTANEQALTVDGDVSSPTAGTVVRLLRLDAGAPWSWSAAGQFAYVTDAMHGGAITSGGVGLTELVLLPDDTLLALERSLASAFPPFRSRIYAVSLGGVTDVSGLAGLMGASYTPAGKTLLWSGGANNLEGLCLGPPLAGGGRALLGIVDDGDPISTNRLHAFQLLGVPGDNCEAFSRGDANCDGAVDVLDINDFVQALIDPAAYGAAHPCCDRLCATDVNQDGGVNVLDINAFVQCILAGGCP